MNSCGTCGGPMKPLLTGFFCPNDCDRQPAKLPTNGPIRWTDLSPQQIVLADRRYKQSGSLVWYESLADVRVRIKRTGQIRVPAKVRVEQQYLSSIQSRTDVVVEILELPDGP